MGSRKLCYICEATQGGVRKHLRDLIRVFSRPEEGYEVHAVLGDRGEPGLREELEELRAGGLRYTFVPEMKRAIRPWRDWRAYMEIKELLRTIKPEIVHTHSSKAGILGRYAAHHLGIENVVHTPHVFPFQWAEGIAQRVYLGIERRAAKFCRALVCVGESQRADALARGVAAAEKLVVIRNGIELPVGNPSSCPLPQGEGEHNSAPQQSAASGHGGPLHFRDAARAKLGIAGGAPAIGMVARLAPQKGVGAFVNAAAAVVRQRSDAVFFVVGGGPLEFQVRARMAELNLTPENFRLLGHREDASELYPAFDVVVLSSLYEGLPYVLLEAMGWGIPVVATDVLGSRDVVADGETGFLARVNDAAHIAERTLALLNDTSLRARCGAAARKRVEQEFSFGVFIEGHRKLYAFREPC